MVADNGKNEVFPYAVGNALTQANYPLAASDVERVLPYRPTDARVEEEVVGGGKEAGGWVQMRPK